MNDYFIITVEYVYSYIITYLQYHIQMVLLLYLDNFSLCSIFIIVGS